MSDANRESLLYKVEGTEGTNPAGAATYLNFTSNSLDVSNTTTASAIVRSDTNIAGTIRTGVEASGDIGIEFKYGEFDPFLEAVMRSTFPSALTITNTGISFANSDNSINGTGLFTNVVEGQWLKISGTDSGTNDGYAKVATKSSNDKLILSHFTATDETAGESITVKGELMKNGTTEKSFTFERGFADITSFDLFTGTKINSLNLNFNTSDIASGSINVIARNGTHSGTSGFAGSHTAASTAPSMNTIGDIKAIYVNGALTSSDFASLNFTLTTNSDPIRAIGSETAFDVRQRSIGVSGSFSVYKDDRTFDDLKRNFTEFNLAIVTEDSNGDGYVWEFPSCRISTAPHANQGVNSETFDEVSFEATLSSALVATAGITRWT